VGEVGAGDRSDVALDVIGWSETPDLYTRSHSYFYELLTVSPYIVHL
jgi:hypothetical protein